MSNLPALLTVVATALGSLLFFTRRALRYLRYFQQEEYTPRRFLHWLVDRRAIDRRGSVVALGAWLLVLLLDNSPLILPLSVAAAAILAGVARREEDPRRAGKLPLRMTARAVRLYRMALALYALALAAAGALLLLFVPAAPAWFWLAQIAFFQAAPGWIIGAYGLLLPDERRRQASFVREARQVISRVDPYVIGITGSYGKTSTKAILGRILGGLEPTFWPPASINTLMGITREIRERMKPEHRYAVIEMGAYERGSIRELCELVQPRAGIITAVGLMHLERFGSPENVYQAKSELAQAIPPDGILVCNGDNEGARRMAREYPSATTLLYGLDHAHGPLDCAMEEITPSPEGTTFTIHWQGRRYRGATRLYGRPMLSNALGAFTMACALGHEPEYVLAALYTLEPEKNRLQLVRDGDTLLLNDAYSSNPVGFAAALDVLSALPGGRKILVTPGMVELGPRQEEENRRAGTLAAQVCDLVLLVGHTNREALAAGLRDGGLDHDRLLHFESRDSALSYLAQRENRHAGDVVLIENDLPDLYERAVRF